MTPELKAAAEAAAETYATGNHSASFADTYDVKAFMAGAEWMYGQKRAFMHLETEKELAAMTAERDNARAELSETRFTYYEVVDQRNNFAAAHANMRAERDKWEAACKEAVRRLNE